MHLTEGDIRTYQDHELSGEERQRVQTHLAECAQCQALAGQLSARAQRVRLSLERLEARRDPLPSGAARARLTNRIIESDKETETMFQKLFARLPRPVWAGLAAALLIAALMAFPSARAIANNFLGLFRVQQVKVVQVNPGDLPERLENSSAFTQLMAKTVKMDQTGKLEEVSSQAEASAKVGFDVRLPSAATGQPQLTVRPGSTATAQIDLQKMREVLKEIGRDDIQLPDSLDGADVSVTIPAGVAATYGDCPKVTDQERTDPDQPAPAKRAYHCTALVQVPSPSISAPPDLNVNELGQAYLELMGMKPEEAAHFSQTVDWTTTFVVPLPYTAGSSQDVQVDGVTGTLLDAANGNEYALIWIKNGIVYMLTGPGDVETALNLANSLQ